MMVWTSRILVGGMDGDWQDLGSKVGNASQFLTIIKTDS
jgi:hypothetical protein